MLIGQPLVTCTDPSPGGSTIKSVTGDEGGADSPHRNERAGADGSWGPVPRAALPRLQTVLSSARL